MRRKRLGRSLSLAQYLVVVVKVPAGPAGLLDNDPMPEDISEILLVRVESQLMLQGKSLVKSCLVSLQRSEGD